MERAPGRKKRVMYRRVGESLRYMTDSEVEAFAVRQGLRPPPMKYTGRGQHRKRTKDYDRWRRYVDSFLDVAVEAERRKLLDEKADPRPGMKGWRVWKANKNLLDRWGKAFPELALSARERAVSVSAAARRERAAERWPAFLCHRCGREERPSDYPDPGQAADLAASVVCWACREAEWLAPIAAHPAAEIRGGVVWLGGVAVGLLATEPAPHEEHEDEHDG